MLLRGVAVDAGNFAVPPPSESQGVELSANGYELKKCTLTVRAPIDLPSTSAQYSMYDAAELVIKLHDPLGSKVSSVELKDSSSGRRRGRGKDSQIQQFSEAAVKDSALAIKLRQLQKELRELLEDAGVPSSRETDKGALNDAVRECWKNTLQLGLNPSRPPPDPKFNIFMVLVEYEDIRV